MTLPIRARLAIGAVLLFGALVSALSTVTYRVLALQLDDDASERLTGFADGLEGYLRFDGDEVTVAYDPADDDEAAFVHEATRYLQVYDVASGRLLMESSALSPLGVDFTSEELAAVRSSGRAYDVSTPFGRVRFVARPIVHDGRRYLLNVGASLAQMDAVLTRYRRLLLSRVPPAFVITIGVVWWLSALALQPLRRLADAASDIDVTTLDRRLAVRGAHDELDQVAIAFNRTLERLERAVGDMRQFSAALAHELRTPLTALRGEIELSLHGASRSPEEEARYVSQLEEIDRLTRLIDQILTLARAESGQIQLHFTRVDLRAVASSVIELLEPVAEARNVSLACEAPGAVIVEGDSTWLRRLLVNLVDNALKFTPGGGSVAVRIAGDAQGARIEVEDTGVGMAPADSARVFERFFRADPSRTSSTEGAGLGLSLVQWIAVQHRGRVSVRSSRGSGSTFTVLIPGAAR